MFQCSGAGSVCYLCLADPHSDPFVRGSNPRIRILTKMSRILKVDITIIVPYILYRRRRGGARAAGSTGTCRTGARASTTRSTWGRASPAHSALSRAGYSSLQVGIFAYIHGLQCVRIRDILVRFRIPGSVTLD
jgi:hypothetical protein